ncbi:MAG: penicillin-binding protein 2 [Actinomycetota bacterium]|jgi:peptidoglycan glycosyltransferase|nr:penicillin-binding protein 2 [Actinomycetota bacterium]MDA8340652.1 penicillin-binding protein 2 [Actinomycetota bacterium]
MEKRIRRVGIFLVLCFVALFIQLNNIQVVKAHSLATNPANPRVTSVALDNPRGDIISANGVTLATSVPATSGPQRYQRVYPAATASLFANIVGFDSPVYGNYRGVEAEYNSYLTAHTVPATSLSSLFTNRTVEDNVTLTLNTKLQATMAAALEAVPGHPPAAAVAIDPSTGAILAMYSTPSFNPNPLVSPNIATEKAAYSALDPTSQSTPLIASAYQQAYAPGSTFKMVTSSAIYEHDPALAKITFPLQGCISLPDTNVPFCNYGYNTPQGPEHCGGNITILFPVSCDTGFGQLGMKLGPTSLYDEARAFGFDQKIPIDLPPAFVAVSNFPAPSTFVGNIPYLAYSAIGQGNVIASPLQMALVASGIANKGVIMKPHVMAEITSTQGKLVKSYTPTPWLRATTPAIAAKVTALMRSVVTNPIGTAYPVGFPAQDDVAAKTGTAQVGVHSQNTTEWMAAFAPASHPTVAIAVVVPNQPGSLTGESTSGPIALKLITSALADHL